MPGIVGFGKAAEIAEGGADGRVADGCAALRDRLLGALRARVPDLHVNGRSSIACRTT